MGKKSKTKKSARIAEELVLSRYTELLSKGFTAAEASKQIASPGEMASIAAQASALRAVAADVAKNSTPAAVQARELAAQYMKASTIATPFGDVMKGDVGQIHAVDRLLKVNAAKEEVAKALRERDTAQSPAAAAEADARILAARESLEKAQKSNELAAGIDRLQKARGEPQYLATQRADPAWVAPLPDHMKTSHPDNEHSDRLMRGGR